ncbi:potassium-transporting ATPase subunit C [Pseudomonas sp. BAY1663]|nr:potassium-transporting ATPase subunit C [Pseudomonas sp. BAY1663]
MTARLLEMRKTFEYVRPAIASLILMALITGVVYPLSVTAVAQLAFAEQANGSLVRDATGQVRGSALLAQAFEGPQWFHRAPRRGTTQPSPALPATWRQATPNWPPRFANACGTGPVAPRNRHRWSW